MRPLFVPKRILKERIKSMGAFLWERVKTTFGWNRMICRLIAAWLSFTALLISENKGFYSIDFMQETVSNVDILITVLGFFLAYSLVSLAAGKLYSDSWLLFLSATYCVVRWVLGYEGYADRTLFALAVAAAYALILIYVVHRNRRLLSGWDLGPKTSLAITLLFGIGSCVLLSLITCLRYKTFSAHNFDFGLFCNMFYNMKETGLPLVTSERDMLLSHFAVHLSPIFYILLPFYYLFPSPLTLQVGQAVFLMAGVIPVYLLCRHFKFSGKATLVISALYAFYPVISTGCFYDIHENCFLPFFLLWTFCSFEKGWYIPMYLSAACVLMVKEDAPIFLLIFALYLLLSRKSRVHGSILALLSVGYFVFASWYLKEHGLGVMMTDRFGNLIYDAEDGLIGVVRTAILNPGFLLSQLFTTRSGDWNKILFFLQMFAPLGFLPFCSRKPSRWLLLTPILINMLTYYQYLYDTGFQYQFAAAAFLVYAMILNLKDLELPTARTMLSIAAAVCCCLYLSSVVTKYATYSGWYRDYRDEYDRMEAVLDTIPDDASVNASSTLVAHLAARDEIYEIYYHGIETDVDFVALDMRYDESEGYAMRYRNKGYRVYAEDADILILKYAPIEYVTDDD